MSYQNELFLGDIELILDSILERLSSLEQQLIYWLANQNQYLEMATSPSNLELSNLDFLKVIQSLERRCLLEKVTNNSITFFDLNPIFKLKLRDNKLD